LIVKQENSPSSSFGNPLERNLENKKHGGILISQLKFLDSDLPTWGLDKLGLGLFWIPLWHLSTAEKELKPGKMFFFVGSDLCGKWLCLKSFYYLYLIFTLYYLPWRALTCTITPSNSGRQGKLRTHTKNLHMANILIPSIVLTVTVNSI